MNYYLAEGFVKLSLVDSFAIRLTQKFQLVIESPR